MKNLFPDIVSFSLKKIGALKSSGSIYNDNMTKVIVSKLHERKLRFKKIFYVSAQCYFFSVQE